MMNNQLSNIIVATVAFICITVAALLLQNAHPMVVYSSRSYSNELKGVITMAERCLLHQSKLDLLKSWLSSKGYEIQATKGVYEVLRATKGKETVIVFRKGIVKEHLTVQQKDHRLIRQFIKETKE